MYRLIIHTIYIQRAEISTNKGKKEKETKGVTT
jgi:hypothetical protein